MIEFNDLLTILLDLKYSKFIKKKSNTCINAGCYKHSNFNYKYKPNTLYCKTHKLNNMINIKSKKCITCNIKRPSFNYKNEKILLYCRDCKLNDMIDISHKKCIYNECDKIPSFNYKNEKIALYCINCKLDDMIDIKSKKCITCNIKQPSFNYKDKSNALYCGKCKLTDMVDIISNKCINCNNKRPSFNYKNKSKALYCGDCKLDNMIDIKSKKCIKCNIKHPAFNYKDKSTALYCSDCKLENMINIKSKKCITCNIKQPNYNYKNKLIALYCGDCKLENMIDIKHMMCNTCNLVRSQVKFNNMCSGCYYYTNPDAILTRNHKSKENQIIGNLNKELNNIIIQDKIISNGCSKRRPDGLIKLNDYNIIIEIDENQHNDYSCENKRLMEIFKDLGNSPLTIIRFNPDAYKLDNKKIKSPFGITKIDGKLKIINKKEYLLRFKKLLETINENLNNISDKEINVIHLFYDS